MNMSDKVWSTLLYGFLAIIALSVFATLYATFLQNDYEVFGVWTEFEDDIAYTEFYFEGEYHEIVTESFEVDDIFNHMAEHIGVDSDELSDNMYYATEYAVDEAYVMLEEDESDEDTLDDESDDEEGSYDMEEVGNEDSTGNVGEDTELIEINDADDGTASSTELYETYDPDATTSDALSNDLLEDSDEEI